MAEKEYILKADEDSGGKRLDVFISELVEDLSRSKVKKLIEDGLVLVDGQPAKAHNSVRPGQTVTVGVPAPEEITVEAEDIPIEIIHEDEDIIVVNKPPGMVVHPAAGNFRHTLVNALAGLRGKLSEGSHPLRPGIVHRLDKETSGCIVVAKDDVVHHRLARLFSTRKVTKEYRAIVAGRVAKERGEIETLINRSRTDRKKMSVATDKGRESLTFYEVVRRYAGATHVKAMPKTGRTHQIRVHMTHLGHPLLGDKTYGRGKAEKRLGIEVPRVMLHAHRLGFPHPRSGKAVEFIAPLPQDFLDVLEMLEED